MNYITVASSLLLMALVSGCDQSYEDKLENNKNLVREMAAKIDAADWDALDALVTEDMRRHSRATTAFPEIASRAEFKSFEQTLQASFPDMRVNYEMMIAEGNKVGAYASFSGTNLGPLPGGAPPTGKSVEVKFIAMFRIEDGKIAEIWVEWDNLSRLSQLGLDVASPSPNE